MRRLEWCIACGGIYKQALPTAMNKMDACWGCVAAGNNRLCGYLKSCTDRIIWVRALPMTKRIKKPYKYLGCVNGR